MPYKVKGNNERAWKEANGNYVQMVWDETLGAVRMQRVKDGALVTIGTSKLCTNNTTADQLAGGATFTGAGGDLNGYATILITIFSDQDSATNGLVVQFSNSNDPYDWHTADEYTYEAGSYKTYSFQPVDQYFRVLYTNGATPTTSLHISTRLHSSNVKGSSHRMADDIKGQDDAELVKAILAAERAGGTPDVYTNIQATAGGNLKVSVEEIESTITLPQSNGYAYNATTAAWEPIAADGITNGIRTVDYAHHEIHAGSNYRVQAYDDAIGNGGTLTISFRTPNTTKEAHMLWEFVHEGDMTMSVLEGTTLTNSTGTDVACQNSNRNSTNTSMLLGVGQATDTAGYVTKNATYANGSIISLKRNYATRNEGTSGARRAEVIMKTNTNYTFVLTNNETSVQGGQIRLEWYEHTPKS